MQMVSKRVIQATPQSIWQIIEDPNHLPAWNAKCVSVSKSEHLEEGGRFEAVFQMRGKQHACRGKIVRKVRYQTITFRYESELNNKPSIVDEAYTLVPLTETTTRLIQRVDLKHSGLPLWVRILAALLSRFGRSQGEDPLQMIESLAIEK